MNNLKSLDNFEVFMKFDDSLIPVARSSELSVDNIEPITKPVNSDIEISFEAIWKPVCVSQTINNKQTQTFDCEIITITKPYPYKSKKKRQIKKWQKAHSIKYSLKNCTITDVM